MKYLLLLRGINVGGKNKVSMKILKEQLEKLGFKNVEYYLNSGNIIFDSENEKNYIIEDINKILLEYFNLSIELILISKDKIEKISENAPDWWLKDCSQKYNIIFINDSIHNKEIINEIEKNKPSNEKMYNYDNLIYWSMPIETTSNKRLSQFVNKSMTIRNSHTVSKLIDLMI